MASDALGYDISTHVYATVVVLLFMTIRAFLEMDHPGKEIILAYNTPSALPVEERLKEIARAHPEFIPLRVQGSTSKDQNVNAPLSIVTGSVVSIHDADHQPDHDSFRRAWRWISAGADVVQGRCAIRNGAASWVSRLAAVEFELMYGVAHPGRAGLHGQQMDCHAAAVISPSTIRRSGLQPFPDFTAPS